MKIRCTGLQKHNAVQTHIRGDRAPHASAFLADVDQRCVRRAFLRTVRRRCTLEKPLTQESSWSQLLDTKSKLPSLSKDTMGLRIDSVIDSVHAAELGTTAHVLGNICQLCVNARVFGATVDADIKNLAIDLDGRCARRRRIVLTTTSRKTTFAPGPTGHNCTPKMLFGDAWSRTLWDWRGNILDPEKNWFAKCWCLCWLLKDNSSRPRPELRWRRWVFASANPTQSSRTAAATARQKLWKLTPKLHLFYTFASGNSCRWVTSDFCVLLRRRHGRPTGARGRIVLPEHRRISKTDAQILQKKIHAHHD